MPFHTLHVCKLYFVYLLHTVNAKQNKIVHINRCIYVCTTTPFQVTQIQNKIFKGAIET